MLKTTLSRKRSKVPTSIDSFESLYSQYVSKVYQKCLTMTKDSDVAQDYTQDIFVKVFSKMDKFENKSTVATWIYSITHNYCLDQIRLNKRLPSETLTYELADNIEGTDNQESASDQLHLLDSVLGQLPVEEVQLLKLKYEQNLSIAELSDHYQIKESAIKMRLKRSRDKLAALFESTYNQ
ncbi:RNA polymerase sigma factor [Spirosoma sp. BT702]|uniref:RNA polymerase sigma factor n=1 Tax=Spirosoma profusum TaxID=2771354 RepID=A0A926XW34_9BACT|nr:RNA polymerase sigma factor [Spirosoma profusum]MBD2701809.1 RNA polymerase sigma factor [Spirosoma profusum]